MRAYTKPQMDVNETGQMVYEAQRKIDKLQADSTPFQLPSDKHHVKSYDTTYKDTMAGPEGAAYRQHLFRLHNTGHLADGNRDATIQPMVVPGHSHLDRKFHFIRDPNGSRRVVEVDTDPISLAH